MSPCVSDATTNPANPGEGIVYLNDPDFNDLPDIDAVQAKISTITGIIPSDDRVAMIESATGFVVSTHFVCPACGDAAYPDHVMVADLNASIGWLRFGGRFYNFPGFHERGRRSVGGRGSSATRNKQANRQQ